MRTAHYYQGHRHGEPIAYVIIGEDGYVCGTDPFGNRYLEIRVSGRVEARRVAKEYDAKPWNF